MTGHNFTDEQIIEALEIRMPHDAICREAYDFINRQRAQIESLNAVYADMTESLRLAAEANKDMQVEIEKHKANAKKWYYGLKCTLEERADHSEAIKEFASRLRRKAYMPFIFAERIGLWVAIEDINEIEKEMTEDNK